MAPLRLPPALRFNVSVPVPRFLRGVPLPVVRIVSFLVLVDVVVWIVSGIVLRYNPGLVGAAAVSFALGLRHALDADHISAIDLMTRRLIASGQKPVAVGTWFSLGHSTIVIITCVVVAATSGALRDKFDGFSRVGNIVGTSVSASFLLILSAGNGWVLFRLVKRLKELLAQHRQRDPGEVEDPHGDGNANGHLGLGGVGFMSRVFRKLFVIVDRPWKMYPVGVMFGLGFDTSSEVALLGIASIQGAKGTSLWAILIFPALFTGKRPWSVFDNGCMLTLIAAGMCLVDTTDGALMMALYTNKAFARDHIAILYYSIVLTAITVCISSFIGIIQVLTLAQNVAEPEGSFWNGVVAIGNNFDIIGGSICGLFLLAGVGSVLIYRPWRRRMDRISGTEPVPTSDGEAGAVTTDSAISPAPAESFVQVTAGPAPKSVSR